MSVQDDVEADKAWCAGWLACAKMVEEYRATYTWGPSATAQNGADVAIAGLKDAVRKSSASLSNWRANA